MSEPKKKEKKKSPFEKACDELKEASDADEQKEYDRIRLTVKSWPKHENPNKDCKVCETIIKPFHCSRKIKQKLASFIPNDCSLNYCCFSKGDYCCPGFNLDSFQPLLYSSSLVALFAVAVDSNQTDASSILKGIIGVMQFDFRVHVRCGTHGQEFWMKTIGNSAFVKGTGTSQITHCMTYAPCIAIKLNDNGLVVLKATKGLLCVGLCNLIADPRSKTNKKKLIKGNSMIWLREDNIEHIEVEFYGKNGVTSNDFNISFISNKLTESHYENPLVLYPQSNVGTNEFVEESTQQPQSIAVTNGYEEINTNPNHPQQMAAMMHQLSQQNPQLFAAIQQNPQGLQQLFTNMINVLQQNNNGFTQSNMQRIGYVAPNRPSYDNNYNVQPNQMNQMDNIVNTQDSTSMGQHSVMTDNTSGKDQISLPPLPLELRLPQLIAPHMANNEPTQQYHYQHEYRNGFTTCCDSQSFVHPLILQVANNEYGSTIGYAPIRGGTTSHWNRHNPMFGSIPDRSAMSTSPNTVDNGSNN